MDIMAARVILLFFCHVACLNAADNSSTPSTMTATTFSASDTGTTRIPSSTSTNNNTDKTQSVLTSASPAETASNTVTTTVSPDITTTATNNDKMIQSIHTTASGTVTEPRQTQSEMIPKTTNSSNQTEGLNKTAVLTETGIRPSEDRDSGLNKTAVSTETDISPSEKGDSGHQSKEETKSKRFDSRYLWLLLLGVAVLVAGMYLRSKFCKVQHHPVENLGHGTENASFQRTESKDGVMLLGVKSGEEGNVAAK